MYDNILSERLSPDSGLSPPPCCFQTAYVIILWTYIAHKTIIMYRILYVCSPCKKVFGQYSISLSLVTTAQMQRKLCQCHHEYLKSARRAKQTIAHEIANAQKLFSANKVLKRKRCVVHWKSSRSLQMVDHKLAKPCRNMEQTVE